jgi:hypothetical protein
VLEGDAHLHSGFERAHAAGASAEGRANESPDREGW